MIAERFPELSRLTIEEKWQLVDELQEELLADVDTEVTPDDPLYPMLQERLAEYRADPTKGAPWSEVRERLRKALK